MWDQQAVCKSFDSFFVESFNREFSYIQNEAHFIFILQIYFVNPEVFNKKRNWYQENVSKFNITLKEEFVYTGGSFAGYMVKNTDKNNDKDISPLAPKSRLAPKSPELETQKNCWIYFIILFEEMNLNKTTVSTTDTLLWAGLAD